MYHFPIGVMLESFHKPAAEAMDIAQKLGAQGLQVYATPEALEDKGITTPKAQKEFFKMVKNMFKRGLLITNGDAAFTKANVATTTMEDGISYREFGVPYFLNGFEGL